MAGDRSVLVGIVLFALIAFSPAVLLWLVLRLPRAVRVLWDRWRPAPPVRATRAPLQDLVADLRRLHAEHRGPPPSTRVRRTAVLAAYDDVLLDVCAAVGIPDPPLRATVTAGGTAGALDADRSLARLRTEAAVEEAGIALQYPAGPAVA
ncbi:hypothetical protein [Pseudonocardia sp. KRD291]|uniref:hypothetical protein n=1 Tax=Pseudonocardia sp. KRD291 TaxID=2792007 RepID=UPI001C4A4CC2|nr:hypothetical protein [Pseudonocardia sp. KRD291]MBW0104940.1 hypothetical protein [Pseudonocardia sp. KRD291]